MGMSFFSSSCGSNPNPVLPNPNPKKFEIKAMIELENTYAEIHYPDCTTYDGKKVLVFHGKVAEKLIAAEEIDPHFLEDKFSPIARFAPTVLGKYMAMQIAKGNYGNE